MRDFIILVKQRILECGEGLINESFDIEESSEYCVKNRKEFTIKYKNSEKVFTFNVDVKDEVRFYVAIHSLVYNLKKHALYIQN